MGTVENNNIEPQAASENLNFFFNYSNYHKNMFWFGMVKRWFGGGLGWFGVFPRTLVGRIISHKKYFHSRLIFLLNNNNNNNNTT